MAETSFATRAVRTESAWAIDELGVSAVVAIVDKRNVASRQLAEGSDFRLDGPAESWEYSETGVMFHVPAIRRFVRAPGQANALDYGCRLMVECSWEEMSELPTRSEHNPAGAPDRGLLVERASTHRKVLCGYSGPFALGVGYDDAGEPVPHHRPGRSARPSCSLEVAVEWTRLTHRGVVGDRATIPDGRSVTDYRSRISTTTSDRESCRWKHPHLYAGNGTQTYACPMDTVLAKLKCTLI